MGPFIDECGVDGNYKIIVVFDKNHDDDPKVDNAGRALGSPQLYGHGHGQKGKGQDHCLVPILQLTPTIR